MGTPQRSNASWWETLSRIDRPARRRTLVNCPESLRNLNRVQVRASSEVLKPNFVLLFSRFLTLMRHGKGIKYSNSDFLRDVEPRIVE